jgi:putative effector of murein hydrolase
MNHPTMGGLLLWSAVTIGAFYFARVLFLRTHFPLFHPSAFGLALIVTAIELSRHPYADYHAETAWISWLLGPAVVAMAVPVYQLRALLWKQRKALAATIGVGLFFGFFSMAVLLWAFRASADVIEAGTLKSITSPVAYAIARESGVRTDAALVGVLFAGIAGSTFGPVILRRLLGVHDPRAMGMALGCGSHGIGVARASELGPQSGAFASLGMSGTAMLGAVIFPYLLHWVFG